MIDAEQANRELPDVLNLDATGPGRYRVRQPHETAEGRDVVFSGQYLAQMIMAAERENDGKDIKSIHAIFTRVGTYLQPIDLVVEELQSGRTWSSHSISAIQNGRLLSRGMVLASIDEPDLIRHGPALPPSDPPGGRAVTNFAFEGAITTNAGPVDQQGGVPNEQCWHRYPGHFASLAANQAILAWSTCGEFIGLAMRPHLDKVSIEQAHRTISTGVIAHTVNFHERVDIGSWLLVSQEAIYAGRGRVHGRGSVFTQDGKLVATFSQDSMARKVAAALDSQSLL
jgi:acyl-CoA thioesterase